MHGRVDHVTNVHGFGEQLRGPELVEPFNPLIASRDVRSIGADPHRVHFGHVIDEVQRGVPTARFDPAECEGRKGSRASH
jgi:hypothetical protein